MPSKAKCKVGWKKMGYKSQSDCESYGKMKMTQKLILVLKMKASKEEQI